MKKEAVEHIKARIAKQKEIEQGNHVPHAEEVSEMYKWIKISILVATPVCVLSVAKDLFLIEHPHRKEGLEPDYMRIRKKEFPWECEDCELFNGPCWKKCREDKAAEAAAAL
jgi:cytochrome c oxidase subunit 6a|eukprot:scaffold11508_cov297-Chaetoceros_neogracile.AAC.2